MKKQINIKKMRENAIIPKYATVGSAAADLYACLDSDIVIMPGQICPIPTGIAISIGSDEFVAVVSARSGLSSKFGITLANGIGVIDSDYRGEIHAVLYNRSHNSFTVHHGDRIAQLMIMPVIHAEFNEVPELDETERGQGGFGSTGI